MICDAIHKEFTKAKRRGWPKIYVFVDFHEVILVPDYQSEAPVVEYYPFAKELLQHLTMREDVCLIAWTCSHPHQIEAYYKEMAKEGIRFDYTNHNPEVSTDARYGYYEQKPYYNILLDDKSGVVPGELEVILGAFQKHSLCSLDKSTHFTNE